MREDVLASRYGKAIFELAVEEGEAGSFPADIEKLETLLSKFPHIGKTLSDVSVDDLRRKDAAEGIAQALKLGKVATNSFKLIAFNSRADILSLILEDLKHRFSEYEKLLVTKVTVSDETFSKDICKKMSDILERILSSKIKCHSEVDPEILGGVILDIGDIRYDASIKGKMDRIKEQLLR